MLSRFLPLAALAALGGAACLPADTDLDATASPLVMANKAQYGQIMLNGISGSFETLVALNESPLASETFDKTLGVSLLHDALLDEGSRTFMHYLTTCALGVEDPPIEWLHPFDDERYTWEGHAGLCSDWAYGPPSIACLEIVSACIIARNNAYGYVVETSQRGMKMSGEALPESPRVSVTPLTLEGAAVASFEPCDEPVAGAFRGCGFDLSQSMIGVCTPGQQVSLSCSDGAYVSARACEGLKGCEHGSAAVLDERHDICAAPLEFACPPRGSYGLMVGPRVVGVEAIATIVGENTVYPAPEYAIFDVREGAFYGNMFDPDSRDRATSVYVDANGDVDIPGNFTANPVVYKDMFACHDPGWTAGDALLNHRLCAMVEDVHDGQYKKLCVAKALGPCSVKPVDAAQNRCAALDAAPVIGDGDYGDCRDDKGVPRTRPITVYLDEACDQLPPRLHRYCQRGRWRR